MLTNIGDDPVYFTMRHRQAYLNIYISKCPTSLCRQMYLCANLFFDILSIF